MTLPRFLCISLLSAWILPASVFAESRLIFPRLVFQQGRFSGVAISNPTSSSATITLTAYDTNGTLFTGDGVSNPHTETILPGSQYVRVGWQIFNPPASIKLSPTARYVWIEVTSPTDGLTGFFLEGDDSFESLDGSDLSGSGSDLIIPYVQNSGELTTELSLINPDSSGKADATVDLLKADGTIIWSQQISIDAHAALQGPISNLLPGSYESVSSVRVRSTKPLAGLGLLSRQPENSLVTVISRKGNSPLRTLYFPQLAQGGDWSTYLGLANLSSARMLVTVAAYKKDGSLFSAPTVQKNPATCDLAAGGSLRTDVKSLFGFADGALQEGWIKAEAPAPALTGYVEYGAGTNRALVSAQAEAVKEAYFSYQVNGAGYYTGIAVLNPSTLAANIEVVSMAASGSVLGKTKRALRPGQREAALVEQWIPGAAGVTDGSILLRSDIPIIATQLFGTGNFAALANVPPQSVPETFDPGGSIASLKISPIQAVVETGKKRTFTGSGTSVSAWKVNDVEGGNSSAGTISTGGEFTAPAIAPASHTQIVTAVSSDGNQTAAASADVIQRETIVSGLTLLTAVAYFDNLQRFFVAEQKLISSAPAGGGVYAATYNTGISEVSSSGTAQSFVTVTGDTIVKMVPFTDGGGGSHLLLAGYDTGTVYRLTLSTRAIFVVQSGLNQPTSLALDPASGDLLVSEGGANQVTVIAKSKFDPTVSSAPLFAERAVPVVQSIPVSSSPRGIAFDPCTGALYVATSDGVLHEYLDNRDRQVVTGLNTPGQVLVLIREDFPTCSEAVTVFVAEPTRVAQIDPRAGQVIAFLESVQDVRDLDYIPDGSPFSPGNESSVIVAEGPAGVNLSRILRVRLGRLYRRLPLDSMFLGGLEFSPPGDVIAYRDRRGDTFATAKSRDAGLAIPDIVGISIYRMATLSVVNVEFAGPVAAWNRGLKNSVRGWIDFDTQSGGGLPSHADPYEPLRPGPPDTDAYVDLSTGQLYVVTAAPSIGTASVVSAAGDKYAATTNYPVAMSFLDNSMSVVIPVMYLDAYRAKVNVTVGNAAEITDIAPEARFAFVSRVTPTLPTVQFALSSSSGNESVTPANLEVTLSPSSKSTATVQYAVTGGTATSGADYTLPAGTLTFSPGETSKSIPVAIIDDSQVEGNETIIVSLSNPVNATLGRSSHTYTIVDNDTTTPTVQFAAASSRGLESSTTVNLNVTLSSASTQTVTVQYAATGGTATGGGTDYTLTPGTLTFAPGETSKNITMSVVSDSIPEPDETVIVTLSNATNATLGPNVTHTYTIINDDTPTVQFASGSSSGSESANGSLNVILSGSVSQTVTVQYAVSGGTATGGGVDYTLTPGTLSFAPGEISKNITLSVVNDTIYEPDETVIVTLSSPTNATLGQNIIHTYTIVNDDPIPSVQFSTTSSSGSESIAAVSVTVTLSNPSSTSVTADFTVGGTATLSAPPKGDFTITFSPVTFAAGQTQQTIGITVYDDSSNEPDETIVLTLTGTSPNAKLGQNTIFTYTIIDNDKPDLTISVAPTLTSSTIPLGGSITFTSATILNSGNAPAAPFSVGFYLSTDAVITASDTLLGSVSAAQGLGVGLTFPTLVQTWPLPTGIQPGTYYVGVLADNGNVVQESNESNNYASLKITVVAPDLIVTSLSISPNPAIVRDTLTISAVIRNQGDSGAGSFSVAYYVQDTARFIPGGKPLLTVDVASLAAGASLSLPVRQAAASTVGAGTWYLFLVVDYSGSVIESNESNNIKSVQLVIN